MQKHKKLTHNILVKIFIERGSMEILNLLENQSAEIIKASLNTLRCANLKSYSKSSMQENKTRLLNLLSLTQQCIKEKNLLPMTEYAENIAKERFRSGIDLY